MRDLGQRVRLVHELRQLRRSEELPHRGDHGFGVDQVVRHSGDHFLIHRHLLFNGPLHADQADPELVLEQFTNRTNTAVSQMIDIIHLTNVLT